MFWFALCLCILFYWITKNKNDERKDEDNKIRTADEFNRAEKWRNRMSNYELEKALLQELKESINLDSPLLKEISSVYNELGIKNRDISYWFNFQEEVMLILMAKRGYLPKSVVGLCGLSGEYNNPNEPFNEIFIDNAIKIIPWVINELKNHYIYDNVYASQFSTHEFYLVGSSDYQQAINSGIKFCWYTWEPLISSLDKKIGSLYTKE